MAEEKKEEPKVVPEIKLTKQELVNIQNLLYGGNFGLSAQQFDQNVRPLINKLAQMTDLVGKK